MSASPPVPRLLTITAPDTGPLPASLLVAGHVTYSGVIVGVHPFVDEQEVGMVRVEYADHDPDEYRDDDQVTVLAVVDRALLNDAQEMAPW